MSYELGYMALCMTPYFSPSAGAFGARPFAVESVVVDGEKYGVIYGAIYPTSYDTIFVDFQCILLNIEGLVYPQLGFLCGAALPFFVLSQKNNTLKKHKCFILVQRFFSKMDSTCH